SGVERLLEFLRAFSSSSKPPANEVEKWYRRLDQIVASGNTEDLQTISDAFRRENLVLTVDGGWTNSLGVFLSGDEDDVPGAAIIRPSVNHLSLWHRIGVADRPTPELAIRWLKQIPSGQRLDGDSARRVRALIARMGQKIWWECGHWINLASEWV